jgi:LPS sulfotransferase NodH
MKTLFIVSLPRTGSSLLSADMRSTSALGEPREWFLPQRIKNLSEKWELAQGDLDGYIAELRKRKSTDNGVVAVKLMVAHLGQMHDLGMLPERRRFRALLDRFDEEPLVIRLLRADKLRQAISLLKARQTGKWGVLKEAKGEPAYDYGELSKIIVQLVKWEAQWERELEDSGITPAMDFTYEELVGRRDETLLEIASRLGLSDAEGMVANRDRDDVKLRKQADDLTEAWYSRFAGLEQ